MMNSTDILRPTDWDSFHGQTKLKRRLDTHIGAALRQDSALAPVLLAGPPGFGKTTLAEIIAERLGEMFECMTMPVNSSTLLRLIRTFSGVVLFDELHRSPPRLQEDFLPLLEFGYLQRNGSKFHADRLSIVGATTEIERVIPPLYDRFTIKPVFEEYSAEEMMNIVKGMAEKAEVEVSDEMATIFGQAAGGVPRNARQLVLALRDMRLNHEEPTAEDVLELVGVDKNGLTTLHHRYLTTLERLGGQAGLSPISSSLRLNSSVVMELERLLIQKGLIQYGERGRELTGIRP